MDEPTPSDTDRAMRLYACLARGGEDERLQYVVIPGPPVSKSRPRFGKGGRVYHAGDNRNAEIRTATFLRNGCRQQFTGNVALGCVFFRPDSQRIDTDNLLKHVCDAANGVLWKDDSQVTAIMGVIELDAENPRTLVVVGHHASTLRRGTDAVAACRHCGKAYSTVGTSPERQFCSARCARTALSGVDLSQPVDCPACQQPFRRKSTSQKYCTQKCARAASRGVPRPSQQKDRACETCGGKRARANSRQCRQCWLAAPVTNSAVLAHWRRGDWAWRYKCDGDDGCGGWHITTDESTREA